MNINLVEQIKKIIPDKMYLKYIYYKRLNKKLQLNPPQTFNEKLQWLKLYDRNPLYTSLVDKYEVKQYVKDIIGGEYIIPTYGVWKQFSDIEFERLPKSFVLKCTHDSGGIVIVRDKNKLDVDEAKEKLEQSLKKNFYYYGREWAYKEVEPRIIAEKYISTGDGNDLKDYKFMCFNGKVQCVFVCSERYTGQLKVTFFDKHWKRLPFERHYPSSQEDIKKPYHFEKMKEIAEKLSKNIPFVRVDLYEIQKKIFFGEMTLYPGCGFEEFTPEEWDYILGEMIDLREYNVKNKR